MNKQITFFLIVSSIFFSAFKFEDNNKVDVFWVLQSGYGENLAIDKLSGKLLRAISNGSLIAIDTSSNRAMSKEEVLYRLEPYAQKCYLTKEEVVICLRVGDFSVMNAIETKYSAKQLQRLDKEGKDITSRFYMKTRPSFETDCMTIVIHEQLDDLDTLAASQRGTIKFITIIAPSFLSSENKNVLLCRIKYDDFLKLGLLEEQKFFDERLQKVIAGPIKKGDLWRSDIIIIDNKSGKQNKLSDIEDIDNDKIGISVFKYFRNSILIK